MSSVVATRLEVVFRVLTSTFAATGAMFFLFPNDFVGALNDVGAFLQLPPAPDLQGLWLLLGRAYLVAVTAVAFLIAGDPIGRRSMMVPLGLGTAAGSLMALVYFFAFERYFLHLAAFFLAGTLAAMVLGAWVVASREALKGGSSSGAAV